MRPERFSRVIISVVLPIAFLGGCNQKSALSGSLSGGATNGSTSVPVGNASCSFNGVEIPSGGTINGYASATVPFGSSCTSETITCTNGALSPANAFTSCTVGAALSCTFNGKTVASGSNVTPNPYTTSSVPFGQSCQTETVTCTNGVLNPSGAFATCTVSTAPSPTPTPTPCSFNGVTVASGSSVTPNPYKTSTVPYGQTCTTETVTCTNGVLSPSGASPICTVDLGASCTFNGNTIASGSNVTPNPYKTSSVPFGQTCQTETVSCTNGVLSPSGAFASCTVASAPTPTPNPTPSSTPIAGSTVPNVTALPNNFPAANTTAYGNLNVGSRPAGYKFNDPVTNVVTWKITDSSHPSSSGSNFYPWYSTSLEISQAWGPKLDQYHLAFTETSGGGWVCDFGLSTSATPGPYNYRALPASYRSYSALTAVFSRKAGNPHIMYVVTSGPTVRLYNVATGTFVDSQAASLGYSSAWPATGWPWSSASGETGWFNANAAENWVTTNNAGKTPGAMYALNLTNGTSITWNPASLDDTYLGYGDCVTGDGQSSIWNLDTNTFTTITPSLTSGNGWIGSEPESHGGTLNGYWIYFNTDGSDSQPMPIGVIAQSTGVATIGSYPGGLPSLKYWGELHFSGNWWLQGSGQNQYLLQSNWDSAAGAPGAASELYALTFVNPWAGTEYRLGHSYSIYQQPVGKDTDDYYTQPHASISHDGKLVIFGSDMLGNSRIDMFLMEVPVTAGTPPSFP